MIIFISASVWMRYSCNSLVLYSFMASTGRYSNVETGRQIYR